MKRLAAILLFLCMSCPRGAASLPEEMVSLLAKAQDHRVEADYSFSVTSGDVPVLYSGHAVFQGDRFRISGNGLEIYCDGRTISCLDFNAREAYIEDAVRIDEYIDGSIGSVRDFKSSSVSVHELSSDDSVFSVPDLDAGWVITDLR